MFEVVSAYANVGLSLGHPTVMTSLSGEFTTISKVVVCAMMIRGRHRGLPYSVDRAVILPGQEESNGAGQDQNRERDHARIDKAKGKDQEVDHRLDDLKLQPAKSV